MSREPALNPSTQPFNAPHQSILEARMAALLRDLERLERQHARLLEEYPSVAPGGDSLAQRFTHLRTSIAQLELPRTRVDNSATTELRLRSFGALEVWVAEQPVRFAFSRCAELVAWLALHGPASREKIVDALWDGSRTASHLEYFRVVVRQARAALRAAGALEFNPIVYSAHTYSLAPQLSVSSDVALLERALHNPSTELLKTALEVYRGEFLPGVTSEWAALRRTKLLDMVLEIALRLAETLEPNDPRAALAAYRWAIQTEPLLEPAFEGLIRLHDQLGERSAARVARAALKNSVTAMYSFIHKTNF